eukprot:TRINITY_DN34182_c0_g1_i1.p3 TRINITY_DN34182_c0_g1~~TRINITY_DN34182_c0_g1_i1.p3  ORF type:complete len:194 (+),score=39.96 TRINITY_DN34182_c0_g1_i1:91-672(+)
MRSHSGSKLTAGPPVQCAPGAPGAAEPVPAVNPSRNLFPHSVVWAPLWPLTACCPCVGHMGLGGSDGRVHDFAGPYCVRTGDFMVGDVYRYAQLPLRSAEERRRWDEALEQADGEYSRRSHDICCENCHHHSALGLSIFGAPGPGGGPRDCVAAWLYCCRHGHWVSAERAACALCPYAVCAGGAVALALGLSL